MSTFKRILESKSEISQKDMKRLQRAAAAGTPEQAKEILKNLESTQERSSRTTRTVPSAKPPKTVEQTPLNKYIRGEAEQGRRVSQELGDAAGVRDAASRGDIKPVQAGETKPAQGATRRARARGAAARQGVDVSIEPSKKPPRNLRLGNTTRGGPIKVTTLKPSKPAPAPTKTQVVKQSDVSKKASSYRRRFNRTNKRGILSREVDKILQDLRGDAKGTRARMSAAVDAKRAADKDIASRANKILRQLRKPSTNVSAPRPTPEFSKFTQDVMGGNAPPPRYTPTPQKQQQPNFRAPEPTKTTPTPTKPTGSKVKVTSGTARVTDLSPTKRPAGTKTFAKFATSGRTALEKQVTLKALKTSPKSAVQLKVTAPPKPKAPTKAAVAPKVKAPKITAGRVAGGALSALGAGFDVVQGREDAKKAGASDTRSWLRGAARAAGGLAGGAVGSAGAGLVGGIAGYSAGSALADKTFTALAGATDAQKSWMKQANLASQRGTAIDKVKYRKGNQAVIYDPRVKKERIGTLDPTSGTFKAANLAKSKAYTAKNPFERLGRQFSRSNEGSGLFGLNIVKGHALADMAKKHYADKDERERIKRVSDFKKTASTK